MIRDFLRWPAVFFAVLLTALTLGLSACATGPTTDFRPPPEELSPAEIHDATVQDPIDDEDEEEEQTPDGTNRVMNDVFTT